jgi:hypothetical protein
MNIQVIEKIIDIGDWRGGFPCYDGDLRPQIQKLQNKVVLQPEHSAMHFLP